MTSFRQDGARLRPVSVNHVQESGVGSAAGPAGFSDTTGIIAGGISLHARSPIAVEQLLQTRDVVGADQPPSIGIPTDQGHLGDHALHTAIDRSNYRTWPPL